MKVLIGTPIHVSKDYSMGRWLQNVSQLRAEYPTDLLLVDNSPGLDYVEKVKGYCKKLGLNPIGNLSRATTAVSSETSGVKNYTIKHLEIPQERQVDKGIDEQIHKRIVRSEEIIRHKFLSADYDAWFFWESDILLPVNALSKLVGLMQAGNFMVITHNCWVNNIPNQVNFHFGITLFKKECLKKYSFIPTFGTDPNMSDSWYNAESWFRRRLDKDGCNYLELQGVIEPIYHLKE